MKIVNHIKNLLKQNEKYCKDGKLFKNVVVEASLKLDPELLTILLSDKTAKETFFTEVNNIAVFDKVKFQKFISNKQFLPDSYTTFKNKIGLTTNGEYLTETNEVVLDFPYKDCVLEGGQTKDDQKRQEVFWNETLAPDEIDRLFEPKVLTNWKSIRKGTNCGKIKEEIPEKLEREADGTLKDNLIIKGNNLIALHSLKQVYKGKVKLIYIDPPYNTGNDSFNYNDSFNHSTWLTFMKNRLEVARELLRDDGVIFVQCDDNEQAYLKVLMDGVFGRENFKECIAVKNGSESGVNAINVMRGEQLFKVKEHILYYAKKRNCHRFKPIYVKANTFNSGYNLELKKEGGQYTVTDVRKKLLCQLFQRNDTKKLSSEEKVIFKVELEKYCLKNNENIFALKQDIQKSGEAFKMFAKGNSTKGIVEEYVKSNNEITLVYKGGMLTPLKNRIVKENGNNYYGTLISDFWGDIGATPSSEGGVDLKYAKKPEKLILRIIDLTTKKNDIVLDYYLGSGTTCAVAHKMGRRYIGIEQMDYIEDIAVERLKKVIDGEQGGISKSVEWQGGGSFIYTELAKDNAIYLDKIKQAIDSKTLINIWNEIKNKPFVSYKVNPDDIDKNISDFESMDLDTQKKVLISLLDKNQMYVNLSEIESADHSVDEEDKNLNQLFYK